MAFSICREEITLETSVNIERVCYYLDEIKSGRRSLLKIFSPNKRGKNRRAEGDGVLPCCMDGLM